MLQWWQSRKSGIFIMIIKYSDLRRKNTLVILVIAFVLAAVYPAIKAQTISSPNDMSQPEDLAVIQGNSLVATASNSLADTPKAKAPAVSNYTLSSINSCQKMDVTITAYSSTPSQTDSTPFITASGQSVGDGIVANNLLPFGTKIRIPELYGDKIFEVQDRMHWRKGNNRFDIWFPSYNEAKTFGVKKTTIEIVE